MALSPNKAQAVRALVETVWEQQEDMVQLHRNKLEYLYYRKLSLPREELQSLLLKRCIYFERCWYVVPLL